MGKLYVKSTALAMKRVPDPCAPSKQESPESGRAFCNPLHVVFREQIVNTQREYDFKSEHVRCNTLHVFVVDHSTQVAHSFIFLICLLFGNSVFYRESFCAELGHMLGCSRCNGEELCTH